MPQKIIANHNRKLGENLAVNNKLIKWLQQPNQWPLHRSITTWEVVGVQSVAEVIVRPQLLSNLHEVCKLSATEFCEDTNLYSCNLSNQLKNIKSSKQIMIWIITKSKTDLDKTELGAYNVDLLVIDKGCRVFR